jgi:exosortase
MDGERFALSSAGSMSTNTRLASAVVILLTSFGLLYKNVIAKLVYDWGADENYSHGFLIVPLAIYLAWERRSRLSALGSQPSGWGLAIVAGSLAVLLAGLLGAELFLSRVAMIGTVVGAIVFVLGWRHLKVLLFPVAVLLLMIPIPTILFNQIVFPLQLLASRVGEGSLMAAGIPVLREGNIIILANTTLEVAEACSGLRSLVSLLTLAIVYGYFTDPRPSVRTAIALASVPVAILANGFRVAGTGIAAHYYGASVAQGFLHTFSGWLVFIVAFLMLLGVMRLLLWLVPPSTTDSLRPSVAA